MAVIVGTGVTGSQYVDMSTPERPIDPPEYPSQPITEQDILAALRQGDWSGWRGAYDDILRDARDRLVDQIEDIMHEWAKYRGGSHKAPYVINACIEARFLGAIQSAIDDYERRET